MKKFVVVRHEFVDPCWVTTFVSSFVSLDCACQFANSLKDSLPSDYCNQLYYTFEFIDF